MKNKQKYLDNIVSYINRVSPINISISDISVSYKLEIILEDVKLYSKNNSNAFFDLDFASVRFNPLRLLINRDIFYMFSEADINNANFYPALFDNSIFNKKTDKPSKNNSDIKTAIDNITDLFIDKNIRIKKFSTKIVDNGEMEILELIDIFYLIILICPIKLQYIFLWKAVPIYLKFIL